jgi:hypothetical protein
MFEKSGGEGLWSRNDNPMTDLETEIESPAPISPKPKPKRVRGNAIERLTRATARHVRDNSDNLANALFAQALKGDVNCTKLLVALIEKIPPRKRKRKFKSIALEWANSPEWKGPEYDGEADETQVNPAQCWNFPEP